ncbi:MAG: DUF1257 domain-containing protein [Cyanobacteriota bacterium]|nr:DUF1257 domain-containing protein [Cyanobacteriota bacterium]
MVPVSHLSILPTVLRDADCLEASLRSLGFHPGRGGRLVGFAGQEVPVELQVPVGRGRSLGWQRQSDGTLALVGDLQRIAASSSLRSLLGRITRAYAARQALEAAARELPDAVIECQG